RLVVVSRCGVVVRVGGGVAKVNSTALPSLLPFAAVTVAGTVTRYSVAIGKRVVGRNRRVRVPTQVHAPGGCGLSWTGTSVAASSPREVTGTIGCEKVTERSAAIGTSPSGVWRRTSSGP